MFLRKIIFFLPFVIISLSHAQKRKKVDTIYVYKNVIIHDTVYLMKPVPSKQNDLIFPDLTIREKFFVRDIYKEEIDKERAKKRIRKKRPPFFTYGIEGGTGFKNSSWAYEFSETRQQFGKHFGLWISKTVFKPQLSVMLSAHMYHWNSTFDLDANKEDTSLNGFYFTKDHQPLLFQRFNNNHFEYALQVKVLYNWKNIRPFAGFLMNKNIYKMQFSVPENNVLDKLDDFKNTQINFGFTLGLQYKMFSKILLSLDYQQYQIKNISLKNSSFDFDLFKTNNTFAERKINFGVAYIISRP